MTEQFKWVDYYEEFASKLLEYRNNRKELIGKIVKVYDSIEMKLKSPFCDFVLYVGKKTLIKRVPFEEYINRATEV